MPLLRISRTETPLSLRCAQQHEWETLGQLIINGAWCPHCAKSKTSQRLEGLSRLQAMAKGHGGVCLSEAYAGVAQRYQFRCAKGHQSDALGGSILRGSWCKACSQERHGDLLRLADGLEKLHAVAKRHDGACLSDRYLKQSDFYRFRCRAGHEWEARGGHVLRGQWCARCSCDGRKLGIASAHTVATERGGYCLSETYATGSTV